MKNIKTIFIKELKRIFTDKRMLLALFMPGILIFIMYTVMGRLMSTQVTKTTVHDVTYVVAYSDNYGNSSVKPRLITYFENVVRTNEDETTNKYETYSYTLADYDNQYNKVVNGDIDVLIKFTDDFENKIYEQSATKPNITILYNGKAAKGTRAYQLLSAASTVAYTNYTTNYEGGSSIPPNVSKEDSTLKQIVSFIFPMLTISLLYSTVISICPEAIAGEKERGTLVSILMTPIKRSEFVGGKILSMMVTAVSSAIVSFLGLIASLPSLFGGANFTLGFFGGAMLLLTIIAILLFFVTFGTLISSLTMSNKEANSYLGPLTVLFIAIALIPTIMGATSSDLYISFIPIMNASACMSFLLQGDISILFFAISIVVNLLLTGLVIFLITRVFKKERFIVR